MKLKITFLLLLTAIVCEFASAGPKVTMRGGGRDQKFNYVQYSNRSVTCAGAGSLVCPVTWGVKNERGTSTGGVIVEYVKSKIESGETSGEALIDGVIPITWVSFEDGFQIELDGELIIDKEYEMK
jgi:hypothetical protein